MARATSSMTSGLAMNHLLTIDLTRGNVSVLGWGNARASQISRHRHRAEDVEQQDHDHPPRHRTARPEPLNLGLDASVLATSSGRRWLRVRRPDLYGSLTRPTGQERETRRVRFGE